jgi:hypothetical protein
MMTWTGHVGRMGRRAIHIGYWWGCQKLFPEYERLTTKLTNQYEAKLHISLVHTYPIRFLLQFDCSQGFSFVSLKLLLT